MTMIRSSPSIEARTLLAAEIVFVSDLVGSGVEWQTTTGITDEATLAVLRAIQRKLARTVSAYYGKRPAAKVSLSKLINSLKGVSSRYLRAEYTGRINRIGMGSAFWSRSYFAGSCGGAPLTVIRQYIEGQKRPV